MRLVWQVSVQSQLLIPSARANKFWHSPSREKIFSSSGEASLKQRAAAKGITYGAATNAFTLKTKPDFTAKFIQECGVLVPEMELKWESLRPSPDKFFFDDGDWLAEFARTNNMRFRGHTLVWNQGLPKWFKETINPQNAENFFLEHIKTVTKHYAGKVNSWDVVNEAIAPYEGRKDYLRKTAWLEFLGSDYIELAFRTAAEADPKALLVYNEGFLEHDLRSHDITRETTLKLLQNLKSKGVPIGALGIQGHLTGHVDLYNSQKLRSFLSDVANLGLKIIITEMDVRDQELPLDTNIRDGIVASYYEKFLSIVLDEKAVIEVSTWGLSDKSTWLTSFAGRPDGMPVRPLPLDENLQPKQAWNAIAKAFDSAPTR
ncbi:MAG: endo-1,4-beta-xylanase [Calothrix sp. SM1_7_51]|nr:endo-1,4-beta-xylanase [Calothrix sp. SM1_7_51]